ncbi:hypothetical protein [Shewanella sp.]|uniref:hypothetical protein n=1 Tax=Shewanella sp. TaxID=50422 RepID=UPI0035690F59
MAKDKQTPRPGFAVSSGRGQASRKVRYVEYSHTLEGCSLCRPNPSDGIKNTPCAEQGVKGAVLNEDGADDSTADSAKAKTASKVNGRTVER